MFGHVAAGGREVYMPYEMFPGLELDQTDPAQSMKPTGRDLDGLSDLSVDDLDRGLFKHRTGHIRFYSFNLLMDLTYRCFAAYEI